jgi:hypothetical protein
MTNDIGSRIFTWRKEETAYETHFFNPNETIWNAWLCGTLVTHHQTRLDLQIKLLVTVHQRYGPNWREHSAADVECSLLRNGVAGVVFWCAVFKLDGESRVLLEYSIILSGTKRPLLVDIASNRYLAVVYLFSASGRQWSVQQIHYYQMGSRDSVVGIATGYRMDERGVGVRVPLGSRIFSSPRRPDWLSGPRSLLSNLYRGLFSWE